ncbi:MAG: methyltransferase domain-containing protein [Chloroflexi bacterium]|nr:methyltransferase domain-containing protein [Chloroflexota bacterium]
MRFLLRLAFRLLYNEFAFTYDLVSWAVSVGQWRQWQRQVIPFIVGERVLEVAHGTGDLQIDLAAAGYKPIALDLSANMGRIAKRKLARLKLSPPFVRGAVQALPFSAGQFTALVSTFPADFIAHPQTVSEFYRVLAHGGRVVFVPAATILPAHIFDRLAKWLFDVTGQSAFPRADGTGWPPKLIEAYRRPGFEIRIESVKLLRSVVWVVVAQKPNLDESKIGA